MAFSSSFLFGVGIVCGRGSRLKGKLTAHWAAKRGGGHRTVPTSNLPAGGGNSLKHAGNLGKGPSPRDDTLAMTKSLSSGTLGRWEKEGRSKGSTKLRP